MKGKKMREIKFRCWYKKEKAYSPSLTLEEIRLLDDQMAVDENDCCWEQFTGLLDKKGTEIYEGDILDCIAEKDYAGETGHKLVIWNNHELRLDVADDTSVTYGLPIIWSGYEMIEVIGNIHENPELLEAKK